MGDDQDRAAQDYWENQEFYDRQLAEYEAAHPAVEDGRRLLEQYINYGKWAVLRADDRLSPDIKTHGTITGRIPPKEENVVRSRLEDILDRMKELEREAAHLASLPKEPPSLDSAPTIIYFAKYFTSNVRQPANGYQYAFIKNPKDGLWYGTGPRAPKGFTWDQLMGWLDRTGPMPTIYIVSTMTSYWEGEEPKTTSECSCSHTHVVVKNPELVNLLEDIAGQEDDERSTGQIREDRMCSNYRQHGGHAWPETERDPAFYCKGRDGD